MTFSLTACSSGPPSDIVESGIEMKATESPYVVYEMTDYDITDETVEERDGREYFYYNAEVEIEHVKSKGMIKGLFGKPGEVET
jgi:hypothetical protein